MPTIMQVRDLTVGYTSRRAVGIAVSNVSFDLEKNDILGIVGESGCGKTTLAIALLNLIEPPGMIQSGSVSIYTSNNKPTNLFKLSPEQLRQTRWKEIAYIPQGSMSALNPVISVKKQMLDTLIEHGLKREEALERAKWALKLVNLEPRVLNMYPHELSGGMSQRVAIALAITMQPAILIADEPTTALDVVTQRAILQELVKIRDEFHTTIILISHDMGVMAQVVDRMAVMYAGCIVELGSVTNIFEVPSHPYTQALIGSIPKASGVHLEGLAGEAPSLWRYPPGCRFHPRCSQAQPLCMEVIPELVEVSPGHFAACHHYKKMGN